MRFVVTVTPVLPGPSLSCSKALSKAIAKRDGQSGVTGHAMTNPDQQGVTAMANQPTSFRRGVDPGSPDYERSNSKIQPSTYVIAALLTAGGFM
jgi:hypothetical protein